MSGPEWAAERVVGAEQAARLIARQFPDRAPQSITELATGWDNTVYLVDEDWVYRFPRRAVAVDGVRREIAVLPLLSGRLPVATPDPEVVGEPTEEFPWPWWGARLVPGHELGDAGLAASERVALAEDIGNALRVLHDWPAEPVIDALPVDPMNRADMSVRGLWLRERLKALQDNQIWTLDDEQADRLATWLDQATTLGPWTGRPVLSHGDLHLRHVLTVEGRASGLIDWGDLCRNHPAVDLSIAYAAVTGPARVALLAAYGVDDDWTQDGEIRARVLAAFLCAALAQYAAAEQRGPLLAESIAGLSRALS